MIERLRHTAAACLMALAAFLPLQASAGDSLQRIIDFKVLKVGMSGNQPPLTMQNREGGIMGFDVDLARALAAAMQVKLEIKTMPFGDLMSALEKDEIDMVISGMSITPQRTEKVTFIGPYMMSGKSILTRNSVLGKISSTDEFNSADIKLLALKGSTSATFVREVAPEANLVEVDNYDDGVKMLIGGKADAMVADMPMCVEPIGIAISKEDTQFKNLVGNYLRAYEKTGVLNQMREKWFEDSAWVAALP